MVDGDTFDIQIDKSRIRLADVDCPETRGRGACQAGRDATAFTRENLAGEWVYLNLDDKTGQDRYGLWVAVAYLLKGKEGNASEPVYRYD